MSMFQELEKVFSSQLGNISQSVGGNEKGTGAAISAAIPLLMGALAKNASKPEGAQSLSRALSKDHDGGILTGLDQFLPKAAEGPGQGILKHVLGAKQDRSVSAISKASGMNTESVTKLLVTLAPVVLGMLGSKQKANNLDSQGLAGLLAQERKNIAPQGAGLLDQFLDADGDGDVDLGDILKKGSGILGSIKDPR